MARPALAGRAPERTAPAEGKRRRRPFGALLTPQTLSLRTVVFRSDQGGAPPVATVG